jgi:hypothetical protein
MNNKQKRGIGYIISGVVYAAIGALTIALPEIPAYVPQIVQAVVLVGGIFGVQIAFPAED